MSRFINVVSTCLIIFGCVSAHADATSSLTLTDAEMQKLKKFFPADDLEHLVWNGDPIPISLSVGKEKRLIFPVPVSVDLKSGLNTDQIRLLNDNKSIYLTALKSFSVTRIYVTLQDSGEVVLIDLTTSNSASNTTQKIDIKKNTIASQDKTVVSTVSDTSSDVMITENSSSVELIRFAWQQVYSPKRLLDNNLHYSRSPMHTHKFVFDLVYGDKVIAYPESSWASGSRYVTAILLRNKYSHKTQIDLKKDLCGEWQAAALYPRAELQPNGHKENDSTMLFLVSSQPFGENLGVCHGDA